VKGDPVRLLTVARLVPKKGLEYAIRAVAALAAKNYEIRYEIAGEGRERDTLKQLIAELRLDGIVTLLGAQDGEAVTRLMDCADVFVLPSVTGDDGDQEGTPVALMEAQAVGLPVVSTRHGGIPEVVLHEKTGLLVPERDVDALVGAIEFLIQHDDQRDEFGRAGATHIREHYDLERVNNDLVELYTRARALHS
jgi:colanic acid/amylovoran biosynthesis glycosyltransferase